MLLPLYLPMFLTYTTLSMPTAEYNLKSVHVVFRHGDSVPATPKFYPKDPESLHDFNPRVHSDLTNVGRMRAYKLGQYLRSRYSDFVGKEYRRSDVYARSTYLERARASLLLVLAGLYPPAPSQRWHPTLDWQPISIESPEDEASDPLMWSIDCSTYREERRHVEATPEFAASIQSLVDFFVALSNHMDKKREFSDELLTDLYTKLWIGIDADVSIPDWTDVYTSPKVTRNAAILRYHMQNYNTRLRRLNGGMLLKKIVDDMTAVIWGENKTKINLYGGQEFNVVALLWALDAWKPIVPTYSSAVILEFWEKDSSYYVKVLYHDGLTGETEARKIEGCAKMCPFKELVMLRREHLPHHVNECYTDSDSRRECFKKDLEIDPRGNNIDP